MHGKKVVLWKSDSGGLGGAGFEGERLAVLVSNRSSPDGAPGEGPEPALVGLEDQAFIEACWLRR
jgi:hypothetical protein